MPLATHVQSNFLGGEISKAAEGRFDLPSYKFSMRVCLNALPGEMGAWMRRPGTAYAGHTKSGNPGRVIQFDFEQAAPTTCEHTDGNVRFRNGATLITTNDAVNVVGVSTANPAVVQVASAVWTTGSTVIFPGASTPLLENREFTITSVDSTHFSIADALTGTAIDGSTLGALASGATVERVHELSTVYVSQSWQSLRAVQAETTQVLLNASYAPQALTVTTEPSAGAEAQFSIASVIFNDGPYLDPPTNGVQVVPSSASGVTTLELVFPAWVATQAYAKGAFTLRSANNYVSLVDQNVGNDPVSSPAAWAATSAGAAINNGQGFLGTDIGRLVRLFSEPALWVSGNAYSNETVVAYNPAHQPGASTYWESQVGSNTAVPGTDLTNWKLVAQGAAQSTWGRITGLSNVINRLLTGSSSIGNMTALGGIDSVFDGVFSKPSGSSAAVIVSGGALSPGNSVSVSGYVGKNYSSAGAQRIQQATVYPSSNHGFGITQFTSTAGGSVDESVTYTFILRAKQTAPTGPGDGTILGTVSFAGAPSSVLIVSNDQATAWNYVWIEQTISFTVSSSFFLQGYLVYLIISQISLYSPTTSAQSSNACTLEILGQPLLYVAPVLDWRLGAYSDTTGWPTVGCYDGARLWLGGAIANRFDASASNAIQQGSTVIDFAPTDIYGTVAANNAISETINADSVNPIYWMVPDLQGILIGTQAGEFLIYGPSAGAITATNIDSKRATRIGSAKVEPRRAEHTLLFVKRFGLKVMEYFSDVFSGKFTAPNIADKAAHITRAGVAELAYTDAQTPILWGRDADNALFGITYKRDTLMTSQGPTYAAWHRHTLGSGQLVESICAGASTGGNLDALTMVVNTSGSPREVHVLTDAPDELTDLTSAWFLDRAVNPTSITVNATPIETSPYGGVTLNGLWHLNGKTVQVFAAGLDCGDNGFGGISDFVVTNGSCFVPFGDGVGSNQGAGPGKGLFTNDFLNSIPLSQIVIGCTYNSDGQIVPPMMPAETGARTGPALGTLSRGQNYRMKIVNALGLSVGTDFNKLKPANFKQDDGRSAWPSNELFSGVHLETLNDDFSRDRPLCWRVSRPFPVTISAVGTGRETQDQ